MVLKRPYLKLGKYTIMNYIDKSWVLLFKQDVSKNPRFFTNADEYLNYYNESDNDIYSILGEAHQWEKKFDQYEFLLEYPQLVGYNHWKQTNFPLDEKQNKVPEGYYNISNTWINLDFGGLIYNGRCSLLKGSIRSSWWFYAIGTKPNCGGFGVDSIPGPNTHDKIVLLWMRIPTIKIQFINYRECSYIKNVDIKFLFSSLILICK